LTVTHATHGKSFDAGGAFSSKAYPHPIHRILTALRNLTTNIAFQLSFFELKFLASPPYTSDSANLANFADPANPVHLPAPFILPTLAAPSTPS
jgi:hypothetical protein